MLEPTAEGRGSCDHAYRGELRRVGAAARLRDHRASIWDPAHEGSNMAQSNRPLEIGTGLFVVLGFAALAYLTTQLPGSGLQLAGRAQSYTVTAQFDDIGGLKVGAPVTMAGVRIGQVDSISIDPIGLSCASDARPSSRRYNRIPDDSNAAIQTSGLLGANYIGITAGASDTFLHRGQPDSLHAVGVGAGEPDQQVLRQYRQRERKRWWQQQWEQQRR